MDRIFAGASIEDTLLPIGTPIVFRTSTTLEDLRSFYLVELPQEPNRTLGELAVESRDVGRWRVQPHPSIPDCVELIFRG